MSSLPDLVLDLEQFAHKGQTGLLAPREVPPLSEGSADGHQKRPNKTVVLDRGPRSEFDGFEPRSHQPLQGSGGCAAE
eukprot:2242606-Pyramimonas_sp.AAC.1